jgi:hypothetical protein
MRTVELVLPKLHTAQHAIKHSAARYHVICAGRRMGKSTLGLDAVINVALTGKPAAWFSPTYKMLADVWRDAKRLLQPVTLRVNEQEKRIELLTRGVIDFWSLDNPDAARGRKYALAVIDEAAMVAHLATAWQEAIRPTLTDYQGGAWFLSTPKGRNFFWQLWQRGMDDAKGEWQSWQMPTSANPFIAQSEIEAARQELPDRVFRQEYLAEFIEDAGGVFRGVRDVCTAERRLPPPQEAIDKGFAGPYRMGVDWGQSNDFTVITVFDAGSKRMVDMDRFNKVDWALQRSRLAAMAHKWKVERIVAEHNSIGGPNIEALRREGLPVVAFTTTAQSKGPLIESLVLAIEKREVTLLNDPVLINELEAYERTVSKETGRSKYGAPDGLHDDVVISVALGWMATNTARVVAY